MKGTARDRRLRADGHTSDSGRPMGGGEGGHGPDSHIVSNVVLGR